MLTDYRVKAIILRTSRLGVKEHVAHRGVAVSEEIIENKHRARVEAPVSVMWVARLFVSVNSPVQQVDQLVLHGDDADS